MDKFLARTLFPEKTLADGTILPAVSIGVIPAKDWDGLYPAFFSTCPPDEEYAPRTHHPFEVPDSRRTEQTDPTYWTAHDLNCPAYAGAKGYVWIWIPSFWDRQEQAKRQQVWEAYGGLGLAPKSGQDIERAMRSAVQDIERAMRSAVRSAVKPIDLRSAIKPIGSPIQGDLPVGFDVPGDRGWGVRLTSAEWSMQLRTKLKAQALQQREQARAEAQACEGDHPLDLVGHDE